MLESGLQSVAMPPGQSQTATHSTVVVFSELSSFSSPAKLRWVAVLRKRALGMRMSRCDLSPELPLSSPSDKATLQFQDALLGSSLLSATVNCWCRFRGCGSTYLKHLVHTRRATRWEVHDGLNSGWSLPKPACSAGKEVAANSAPLECTQLPADGEGNIADRAASGTLLNLLELAEGKTRAWEHSMCSNTLLQSIAAPRASFFATRFTGNRYFWDMDSTAKRRNAKARLYTNPPGLKLIFLSYKSGRERSSLWLSS